MMNKISSCLKWTWSGGPSPGLCHAMMTEVAPPVASVVRSTSMSRPKGLIDNACLGATTTGCSGVLTSMDDVSRSSRSARVGMSRIKGAPHLPNHEAARDEAHRIVRELREDGYHPGDAVLLVHDETGQTVHSIPF